MPGDRDVQVHLLPELVPPGRLTGGLAVVVDVLRATTTIIHALAAGCTAVRPCAEVEEARQLAGQMRAGRVLLGGERIWPASWRDRKSTRLNSSHSQISYAVFFF